MDLVTRLSSADSVLLVAPDLPDSATGELLRAARPDATEAGVVLVVYGAILPGWIADWRSEADSLPSRLVLVKADTTSVGRAATYRSDHPLVVDGVEDPSDLASIGQTADRHMRRIAGGSTPLVVGVHSLTRLLQLRDAKVVYRFCHLLATRVGQFDGQLYVAADESGTTDRALAIFRELFDATVEVDGGEPRVRYG